MSRSSASRLMIHLIESDKPELSVLYKITHNISLSKEDFERAYKILTPKLAFELAKFKGVDIEICQESCLKKPIYAFLFALEIKNANIKKCQEVCLKYPEWAYQFALDIPGADIEKCQEAACKDSEWAYCFAKDIPGADIKRCEEVFLKDPAYAHYFTKASVSKE